MAPILRIVKGPNVKKLLSLAALAAVVGATAMPAAAATQTGSAIVKWNTSVAATLTLVTTYNNTGASIANAALYGAPAATCANMTTEVSGTLDYGTITPSLSANVNCLYTNAVDANVVTNSASWNLYEEMNTPSPAALSGYKFCAYPNSGYASFPATVSSAVAVASSVSGRSAATADTTTCGGGSVTIPFNGAGAPATSAGMQAVANSTTPVTGTGTWVGEDLEMLIAPGATSGAGQYTLYYLLVAN